VIQYVIRRVLWMVPTMVGITMLLFVVMRLAPGDPALAAVGAGIAGGDGGGMDARTAADFDSALEKFRERHGLDKPLLTQYAIWIGNLTGIDALAGREVEVFDFGNEFQRPAVPVKEELGRRLQVTVPLAVVSVILSYLIALPLGIFSAVRQGTLVDQLVTLLLFLLYSLPTFWTGLMLILAFGASGLDWLPILGLHDKDADTFTTWEYVVDLVLHAILPVVTLTYSGLAYLSRQMRVGMLETVRQDYIRTARAKGLSERTVVLRHALRNSLIPVITVFAQVLPILIGGSVLVEAVFGISGMGLYAFEGLLDRDYNVVMATVTLTSFLTLLGFLISDVLYAVVDPRISHD